MQISTLIGKKIYTSEGEMLGYITGVLVEKNLSKCAALVCADEEEEELLISADAVRSIGDIVVAEAIIYCGGSVTPAPIGKIVYSHLGERLGVCYDLILAGKASALFADRDGNTLSFPTDRICAGEAIIVYPKPTAQSGASRRRGTGRKKKEVLSTTDLNTAPKSGESKEEAGYVHGESAPECADLSRQPQSGGSDFEASEVSDDMKKSATTEVSDDMRSSTIEVSDEIKESATTEASEITEVDMSQSEENGENGGIGEKGATSIVSAPEQDEAVPAAVASTSETVPMSEYGGEEREEMQIMSKSGDDIGAFRTMSESGDDIEAFHTISECAEESGVPSMTPETEEEGKSMPRNADENPAPQSADEATASLGVEGETGEAQVSDGETNIGHGSVSGGDQLPMPAEATQSSASEELPYSDGKEEIQGGISSKEEESAVLDLEEKGRGDSYICCPKARESVDCTECLKRQGDAKAPVIVADEVFGGSAETEGTECEPTENTEEVDKKSVFDRFDLLGRYVRKSVYDDRGALLICEGELITPKIIRTAREHNRLLQLTVDTLTTFGI